MDRSNEFGIACMNLNQLSLLGESASPFIDEGDGLTSERERVQMLLNLVAHVGRYRMMVGAHNTVGCQMHVGGYVVLFGYGKCRYLHILLMPRGM